MPIKDLCRSFSFDLSAINCLVNLSRLQTTGRFSIIFEGAEMLHAPYCYRESWSEFLLYIDDRSSINLLYLQRRRRVSAIFEGAETLYGSCCHRGSWLEFLFYIADQLSINLLYPQTRRRVSIIS